MKQDQFTSKLRASCLAVAFLAMPTAHAASITKSEYQDSKGRISSTYKADKTACAPLKANAKDICVEEAKAKEKVARAELEFSYTGKPADQTHILVAKAKSAYAVAKERCDDQTGNAKSVCVKEAKAVEVKALADAKLGKVVGEARKDAAADKAEADYKVASQKCDALGGDAKSNCVTTAKMKFGKS